MNLRSILGFLALLVVQQLRGVPEDIRTDYNGNSTGWNKKEKIVGNLNAHKEKMNYCRILLNFVYIFVN